MRILSLKPLTIAASGVTIFTPLTALSVLVLLVLQQVPSIDAQSNLVYTDVSDLFDNRIHLKHKVASKEVTFNGSSNAAANITATSGAFPTYTGNATISQPPAPTIAPPPPSFAIISPYDSAIEYIGRWNRSADTGTVASNWGGAYLRVGVRGTASLSITLAQPYAAFNVLVDDRPAQAYFAPNPVPPDSQNITINILKTGIDKNKDHVLKIAAYAESDSIQLRNIILDNGGTVFPTANGSTPEIIEFIGDSITAGATLKLHSLQDYSWQSAETIGVQHTQIAMSGITLLNNTVSFVNSHQNVYGMEDQYNFTQSPYFTPLQPWDFGIYAPQVIVVNIGTNDYLKNVDPYVFQTHYSLFLRNLFRIYPNVTAILALQTFGGFYDQETYNAVRIVSNGLDGLPAIPDKIVFIDTGGWIAIDDPDLAVPPHPNELGHQLIASRIIPVLKNALEGNLQGAQYAALGPGFGSSTAVRSHNDALVSFIFSLLALISATLIFSA